MCDAPTHFLSASLIILALAGLSAALLHFSERSRVRKYPPGPPGLPFIGNVLDLATKSPHLYYRELGKAYGDVVHVSALGQPIILLGSYEAAHQLFSQRGSIYSNRPPSVFAEFALGLIDVVPIVQYGPIFKEQRRIFHTHLSKEVCRTLYRADVEAEARNYVLRAVKARENYPRDYEVTLQKTFLNSFYGIKITDDKDDFLQTSLIGTDISSASLVPGRYLVNIFPWLKFFPSWFPGTNWKEEGKRGHKILQRMVYAPFKKVRQEEVEGTDHQSFALSMLHEQTILTEDQLAKTVASSFVAGGEPTGSFIQYFIYAMLMYPEVQKTAQAELDHVVGRDRLPTADDYPELPYLEAMVKELHRWRPVAPAAVPHQATQDDLYEGYLIPKGAIVVANLWGMSMNEKVYTNPDQFNPDRFMVKDPPMDPRFYSFGVGRRVCPGLNYAEVVYMAAMTTILATVNIVRAHDADGNEIYVQPGAPGKGKLINAPIPFAYQFQPRSEVAMSLLRLGVGAS